MKIMIISDLAPPYMGGGESYVIQLGTYLTKLGHEVHWLTSRIPNTNEYEDYQGIHIHRVPILFSKKFLFPGRQTFPFMAVLQKLDFVKEMDIVQANTLVAGYSGWKIARKYNKPSLLFCHEFFGDLWAKLGQNILEKKIYPRMERRIARSPYDWYACPSEYSKSTLINAGAPEDKITEIPHGINHHLYNPSADGAYFRKKFKLENKKLFGYLGRLRIKKTAQSKNLVTLLEATKIVVKEMHDAKLVIAGAGYEDMAAVVRRMKLEEHVIYIGNIHYENNPRFLKMCDLVVCPALSDGFCFLLAEASACGVPTVATNLGSHPERIVDGKTGLVTEPVPESLANSILDLLQNESKAEKFGNEGQKYSKTFTWKHSSRKHLEVYAKLLERNG
ncbi:MAG: glycosyltransferase family 4 protein [Nitrososphaerales archaeon]